MPEHNAAPLRKGIEWRGIEQRGIAPRGSVPGHPLGWAQITTNQEQKTNMPSGESGGISGPLGSDRLAGDDVLPEAGGVAWSPRSGANLGGGHRV